MDEQTKNRVLSNFKEENLVRRYQQFIEYIESSDGIIDSTEYKVFVESTLKRDLVALAHGYLQMIFTFEEYYKNVLKIVGFDLYIQQVMNDRIKAKNNGKNDNK